MNQFFSSFCGWLPLFSVDVGRTGASVERHGHMGDVVVVGASASHTCVQHGPAGMEQQQRWLRTPAMPKGLLLLPRMSPACSVVGGVVVVAVGVVVVVVVVGGGGGGGGGCGCGGAVVGGCGVTVVAVVVVAVLAVVV